MRTIAAASMALLVLVSCAANDELADQGERSRTRKEKNAGAGKAGGDKGKTGKGPGTSKGGDKDAPVALQPTAPGSGAGAAQAPQDFGGGDAPSSGIDPSLARAASTEQDPASDARKEGLAPAYTEATGTSIHGLGDNVRFTMTFGGDVPQTMQKNQYMVMAFGITGRKEGEGYALGATCDEKGWSAYAGYKGENQTFPGRFQVKGNRIVMELPWSFLRGPRAFEWYASTGWYSQLANQTHWSFDAVPNNRAGEFPR